MTRSPRLAPALAGLALAAACSSARLSGPSETAPGLTLPARIAEGSGEDAPELASPVDGGAESGATSERSAASPPDPEPLALERQWEYRLRYERGRVMVVEVRALRYPRPVVTARRMGRYAIELWIGRELVDRVRLEFPATGADAPPVGKRRPLDEPVSLAAGAVAEVTVLVPASPRATRAVLVDRATGAVEPLAWPPDAPLGAVDAGS
ncbi:MAG: hypothetical protein OZ921_07330 [Sorangiineae bacterium]|nr:hypothetical protein [Polyangiaceae bacterium]MEB2322308.1 hypothetical protein [Sorangiineae bacterium]